MLAIDLSQDGPDGVIDRSAFTQWTADATLDMDALAKVFDTDHNGRLDAGDAISLPTEVHALVSFGIAASPCALPHPAAHG